MNALKYEYIDYLKMWEERINEVVITNRGFSLRSSLKPISEKSFYILRRKFDIETLMNMDIVAAAQLVVKIISLEK